MPLLKKGVFVKRGWRGAGKVMQIERTERRKRKMKSTGRKVARVWRTDRMCIGGEGLTVHVDPLLLTKRGAEVLNLCREASLDVLRCEFLLMCLG